MKESCATCYYWDNNKECCPDKEYGTGRCLRYPPMHYYQGAIYPIFPFTNKYTWCGEYSHKDE